MKELRCDDCKEYLGELIKGRLKKGAVLYCATCVKKYVALKLKDSIKESSYGDIDVPDFLNDLLKKGK